MAAAPEVELDIRRRAAAAGDAEPGNHDESRDKSHPEEGPFALDGYEWFALFPFRVPQSGTLRVDGAALPDPAADLRDLKPHDYESMLAACRETRRPGIALLVRAHCALWLGNFVDSVCICLLRVPVVAAALTLAGGSILFPARNLWLGAFALPFDLLWSVAVWTFVALKTGDFLWPRRGFRGGYIIRTSGISNMFSWSLLVRERPHSRLLMHRAQDPSCTCTEPACSGDINRIDATARISELCVFSAVVLAIIPFLVWTPAVTLSSAFWPSPWAVAGALCMLSALASVPIRLSRIIHMPSIPSLRFEGRLRLRASALILEDLLSRNGVAVRKPGSRRTPEEQEPYVDMCRTLSEYWSFAGRFSPNAVRFTLLLHGSAVLLAFAFNAGAGCMTAWQLASLAQLAGFVATMLVHMAEQNAQVAGVTELWIQAQGELRMLALRTKDGVLKGELEAHARALASFVERGNTFRAKLLGITVDYGTLRALVATAITVAVGLFGILRAAGLRLTLETFCPV